MQLKLHRDKFLVLDGMTRGGKPCVVAVCDSSLTDDAKKKLVRNNNVGEKFLILWERERDNMHIKQAVDLLMELEELWREHCH